MEKKKDLQARKQILNIGKKHWLFIVVFVLMALYLQSTGPMNNISGDAASIWHTIKSFHSEDIVPSYVLYKGFASVYPYVWFYDLSVWLGVGEFFFIKIYHCLLFAYISTIGFPYFISRILKVKPKVWQRCLLVIAFFYLWKSNLAFNQLMVDLPSLGFFLMALNSALKIEASTGKRRYGRYLYTGLLIGLNFCVSGQYSLPAILIVLFVLIKTIPLNVIKEKAKRVGALACIAILLVSAGAVRMCNVQFEKNVVEPFRAQGEWLPTGDTWIQIGFTRLMGVQRSGSSIKLPDNRGLSIIKEMYGDDYEKVLQDMIDGKMPISIGEYFSIALKNPVDFVTRYANRLFLCLSVDNGSPHVIPLFISYTCVFLAFLSVLKRCKTIKQFFSPTLILILSFIAAVAALVALNVEIRCVMQLQGLVVGAAILDTTLWDGFKQLWLQVKHCWQEKSLRILGEKKFPWKFLLYCVFMIFCFMHIASIYETVGVDPAILFRW